MPRKRTPTPRQRAARRYWGAVRALAQRAHRTVRQARTLYRLLQARRAPPRSAAAVARLGPGVLARAVRVADDLWSLRYRRELFGRGDYPSGADAVLPYGAMRGENLKDRSGLRIGRRFARAWRDFGGLVEVGVDFRITYNGEPVVADVWWRHVATPRDLWPVIWAILRQARALANRLIEGSPKAIVVYRVLARQAQR